MTDINEFNITDEELREIEQITELAQDCTNNLIDCLVDPDTEEKVELDEEDKKFYNDITKYFTFCNIIMTFKQYYIIIVGIKKGVIIVKIIV